MADKNQPLNLQDGELNEVTGGAAGIMDLKALKERARAKAASLRLRCSSCGHECEGRLLELDVIDMIVGEVSLRMRFYCGPCMNPVVRMYTYNDSLGSLH
ncbi:hypothetical protein ACH6CV_02075 [Bacillota bacterium Meth-B3]|nr:hypothetical protein [Christensenellaceae bacterium]